MGKKIAITEDLIGKLISNDGSGIRCSEMAEKGVRTKFESTTLSLSFDDNNMKRYINYVIHVRTICYLKYYLLFCRNSDRYQQEYTQSASEYWLSTSASEVAISEYQNQKNNSRDC